MLWKMIKIRIRSVFAGYEKKNGSKGRAIGFKIFVGALVLWALLGFLIIFGMYFSKIAMQLTEQDSGFAYFSLIGLLIVILGFVTTVFAAQAQIFDAKDNELLLSMPIPVSYIIISRVVTLLIIELVESVLIGTEAVIVYNYYGHVSGLGILYFALGLIGANLITAVVSVIFGWLLAFITSNVHRKSLVTTVATVVISFGFFRLISVLENYLNNMLNNDVDLDIIMRKSIYPFYCFGIAVEKNNGGALMIFLLISVAAFAVIIGLLSRFFAKIATTKKGSVNSKRKAVRYKEKSIRKALVQKELRRFFTNAAYMLNTGIGILMIIVGAVLLIINKTYVYDYLAANPTVNMHMGMFAIFAVMFFCALTAVSAPSISLEGDNLWIPKVMPVKSADVLMAKINAHMIVCMPGVIFMAVALNIALPLTPLMRAAVVVMPVLYTAFMAHIGLIDNLLLPKFDWADEAVAVKQSMAVIATMGIGFAVIILFVGAFAILSIIADADGPCAIIFNLALAVSLYGMRRYVKNKGSTRFEEL